jgi:hypothetical protein
VAVGSGILDRAEALRESRAVLPPADRRPRLAAAGRARSLSRRYGAAFVALATDVAGVILLEAIIGNRAFTEDAAAQSAPLATSLGVPVVGFDAYLAEWRARRERFSDDAERLLDRWIRFALAPLPGGAYRVRALARRASIFFEADAYVTRWT